MVKERAKAKFDETVEIAMNLGVDPRHADQMVRGVVPAAERHRPDASASRCSPAAPRPRRRRRPAPTSSAPRTWSRRSRAAQIDFDRCIATPDMMPLVGRLGKVLGPRGLMPNPKVGTVTKDVATAVTRRQGRRGRVPRREGGHHPGRRRQGELRRAGAGRQHQGVRRRRAEGAAGGRQGHVRSARRDLLDHGTGSPGRSGDARRVEAPERDFRPGNRAAGTWCRAADATPSGCPDPVRDCRRRAAGLIAIACNRREGTGISGSNLLGPTATR